jgi:hypothetical protein
MDVKFVERLATRLVSRAANLASLSGNSAYQLLTASRLTEASGRVESVNQWTAGSDQPRGPIVNSLGVSVSPTLGEFQATPVP